MQQGQQYGWCEQRGLAGAKEEGRVVVWWRGDSVGVLECVRVGVCAQRVRRISASSEPGGPEDQQLLVMGEERLVGRD